MANVILSAAEFLKVLSVGDTFWYMTECNFVPEGIFGPCVIDKIKKEKCGYNGVIFIHYHTGTIERIDVPEYLTDSSRGVFLSEDDANKYLAARKKAFEKSSRLIGRAIKRKGRVQRDSLYDDDEDPMLGH